MRIMLYLDDHNNEIKHLKKFYALIIKDSVIIPIIKDFL